MQSKIDFYINQYLYNRPAFMAIIRSQEAMYFQEYLDLIKPIVLDYGCGDGFFAATVFGKRKIDIGLDLKNSRAQEAKQNRIYKKVVYYDGRKIPFPDNYFSTIIANCVFEHLPNLQSSLKELNRVLKPDGYLLTTVMNNKWNNYLFGKKFFGKKYCNFMKNNQQHINLFSTQKWNIIFNKNGFTIYKQSDYLKKYSASWLDIFHYLSIPSLLSYIFWKKWVIFPFLNIQLYSKKIIKIVGKEDKSQGAAIFYVLRK